MSDVEEALAMVGNTYSGPVAVIRHHIAELEAKVAALTATPAPEATQPPPPAPTSEE